ncbi:GAREM1 [Branchiostoma lanceolatum]|uniref:GAREM1 protein n=1 Tax=Branchiostoma lanceolatum TaxID=7740 RepID=A0A8J9ZGY9_BRALA|nr:GAREM1 [Branchiostoma lanceolatum]
MAGRATLETVEWIDYRDFSPEEFLEEANDFPQMVQISEGFYGDGEMWSFSSGQIFKIHGVKTQEKVVTTVEGGRDTPGSKVDKLHIPLNYGGYFEVLPFEQEGTDVVYNSVKEVARNFPRYVCVDTDMSVTSDMGGVRLHRGDQIELLENAKRPTKNGLKPFLKCRVNDEKECFLPHECRGRFLVIPDENSYTISDIIKRFPLPRRVQFFGGYINYCSPEVMQSLGYSFDGILQLEGTTVEKYLVATTQGLTKTSNENKKDLLVMPIKAKIKFLVAKGLFERSSEYETVLTAFSRDFDVDRMSEHPYMSFEFAPLTYQDEEEAPPPLARGPCEEPPVPGADEPPPKVDRSSKPETLVRELSTSSQAETGNYTYDSNEEDYETISDDDYDSVPEGIVPPTKGVTRPVVPPEEGEYEFIDEDRDTPPGGAAAPASRQKTHQRDHTQAKQNPFAAELKSLFAQRPLHTQSTPISQYPKFSPIKSTTQPTASRPTFEVKAKLKPPTLTKPTSNLAGTGKVAQGPVLRSASPKSPPAKPPVAPRREISSSSDEPRSPARPSQSHKTDPDPKTTKVTGWVSPLRVTEDEDQKEGGEHISVIHNTQRKTASGQREVFSSLSDVPTELSQLTIKQVSNCLQLLNMAEYVPRFERDQVDGNLMCDLDQEMLTEMGVSRVHSMKLKKFIKGWRPNADN